MERPLPTRPLLISVNLSNTESGNFKSDAIRGESSDSGLLDCDTV
jgi:hypothetical protein